MAKSLSLVSRTKSEGLLIHTAASLGFERRYLAKLIEIAPKLSPETKEEVRNVVVGVGRKPLDFDEILDRDLVLAEQEYGSIQTTYMRIVTQNMSDEAVDIYKEIDVEVMAMTEELLGHLKE